MSRHRYRKELKQKITNCRIVGCRLGSVGGWREEGGRAEEELRLELSEKKALGLSENYKSSSPRVGAPMGTHGPTSGKVGGGPWTG